MLHKRFKILWSALFLFFLTVFFGGVQLAQAASTPVFINEVHYDNTGMDINEFVEIAGPVGTNLTGWSIICYNGSTGLAYNTQNLSGTIPNAGGGFGFVKIAISGMQNGSPDGIALFDAATLVQFLSYEGAFTAADGPANGTNSIDIGVSEIFSNPIGNSLQLAGNGSVYEDFAWANAGPETPAALNNGQSFVAGNTPPTTGRHQQRHPGKRR